MDQTSSPPYPIDPATLSPETIPTPVVPIDALPYWKGGAQEIKTFRGHSQGVWSVDYSPDGLTLASGGGDRYLRKLLVHGGRAVVQFAARKTDPRSQWVTRLVERRGANRAAIAVANRNARIIWSILTSDQSYRVA